MTETLGDYAGLVTRTIAFAIDAAIINLAAATVAVVVGLGMSVLDVPDVVVAAAVAVGGVAYVLWTVAYSTTFWSTTGQTPGSHVMRIQVVVCAQGDERLSLRRAVTRLAGMVLAAVPFFAGFLLIAIDDRRRGLQDRLARTLVLYVAT